MRISKIHVEDYRLWYNIIVVALFFLLYIFPEPTGTIFNYARILVLIGIIVGLFWISNNFANGKVAPSDKSPPMGKEVYLGNHVVGHSRHDYDQLMLTVFDIISSLNSNFDSALYMIDPMSNGYTLQKATGELFTDFIGVENEIIHTILTQDDSVLIQQKDSIDVWQALFNANDWIGS